MKIHDTIFIGGAWVPGGDTSIDVIDSATEEIIARVPEVPAGTVDAACRAAAGAFVQWAATDPAERAALLGKLHEALARRSDEIAEFISREVGMPLKLASRIQVGLPLQTIRYYAELLSTFRFDEIVGHSKVLHVPKGVVAAITPWNYPLHQLVNKVVPALAAGCTVVAKPSEEAPLSAFVLAEAMEEAGFPHGTFNLVCGKGASTGQALVDHPVIDMISFTGSGTAGAMIGASAARTAKRVTLELGGKSPSLVLDDADLQKAVRATISNCFLNSGQTCTGLTRLLVPRDTLAEVEDQAAQLAGGFVMGDPGDPSTRLGPLVSDHHRARVLSMVEKAERDGNRLLAGGSKAAVPEKGFFVAPTIFSRVEPDSMIAQEEVFGPVLSIISYADESEAIKIANGTRYGLAAAVWSGDTERAFDVARRIRSGQVDINGAAFNPQAPFGGFGASGHGRELGRWGLEEFLEPQSIQLPVD